MIIDYLKNQVLTEKTIHLLQQNQYTFDVIPQLNKIEIKNWIEDFFNVKVESINSHRLPIKKKGNRTLKHSVYTKRMIVKLKKNYSIPLFLNE